MYVERIDHYQQQDVNKITGEQFRLPEIKNRKNLSIQCIKLTRYFPFELENYIM